MGCLLLPCSHRWGIRGCGHIVMSAGLLVLLSLALLSRSQLPPRRNSSSISSSSASNSSAGDRRLEATIDLQELQLAVDCTALLQPIHQRRQPCLSKHNQSIVDVCVYFASDYEFMIPFLVHHLSLGVSHIIIYNNDEKVAWYRHPSILCLIAEAMVEVQPWFGDKALMKGLNHCFRKRIPDLHGIDMLSVSNDRSPVERSKLMNIWGANFDIDEMLVLHKHQCISQLLPSQLRAPSLALNWAFFVPEAPLSDYARTGHQAFLPARDYELHGVVLPHDKLLRRMFENPHVKSVNRVGCVELWHNEHCPKYSDLCPSKYGQRPVDPEGRYIECKPWTPWVDNHYPVAQLNHYWTLSLDDFLRKIHRGKGGSYTKHNGSAYRSTGEFHTHAVAGPRPFVEDRSFLRLHGELFSGLKKSCPRCFDTAIYRSLAV